MKTKTSVSPNTKAEAEELVNCVIEGKILEGRIEALKQKICPAVRAEIHINGTIIKRRAGQSYPFLIKGNFEKILRDRKVLPDDALDKIISEASVSRQIPERIEVWLGKTHKDGICSTLRDYGIVAKGVPGNGDNLPSWEKDQQTTGNQ
ncbi:MAG: hypothetical protein NT118_16160 [Lentisphaerae bacterium]|nr:hypothetical protein [Lentisphaerota bacterium]